VTPARRGATSGLRRLSALVAVVAVLVGGGLLGDVAARQPPRTVLQPRGLAAEVAPIASNSSSWYCPGAPDEDAGTTQVVLANAAPKAVRIGAVVVTAGGQRQHAELRLGAHAESILTPARLVHGAWVATDLEVAGGAVSATEVVDNRRGRSVAPCASEVSPNWYFASGTTASGSTLTVTLFNPTPNLAVVDLGFVTSGGHTAPAPFQGLVVKPGRLRTLTVGRYVEDQASIATVVSARAGALVAGELELDGPGGTEGLSFSLGAPAPAKRWCLPSVEDFAGGASSLSVFNPSGSQEHVVVSVRLATGPVEPFSEPVGPQSVWTITTSDQLRIAPQEPYSIEVRSTGPGTVVARSGTGSPNSAVSWRAADLSLSGLETSAAHRWLVAALPGAIAPSAGVLALVNPGVRPVVANISWWAPSGERRLRRLRVPAHARVAVPAPSRATMVGADGPLAVVGDASPPGTAGVIAIPGIPLR
jgi:hypothetical protein